MAPECIETSLHSHSLQDRTVSLQVDPWLSEFPEEPETKKDRCGIEMDQDGPDGPPDIEDTLTDRRKCCHSDHKRYVPTAEKPLQYPYSLFDPEFVEYDEHLTPPTTPVKPYPERLTEDDVRNNPPSEWKGTKGFFTPEPGGNSSKLGVRAAEEYYKLVRPLEGTLSAMNATKSIKSKFMM
ncbi:hypothetical protein KC19_3G153100 [Ceratodon purpureus]|uniref:Uncharacterized protein n=1 Tax=Ceratodon purpureus TaxID=3225 RepID=A0A8T0IK62_CERPU|nr:hypothetical protein KC19_3G153100 [Ceratodon purpureus]